MTIDFKISNEKLHYNINKETAKISALSANTIDKYESLKGEEILPFKKIQITKQTKFTQSSLGHTEAVENAAKNKQYILTIESKNKP